MKYLILIITIGLLLTINLAGAQINHVDTQENITQNNANTHTLDDELDQYQTNFDFCWPFGSVFNIKLFTAQSFIPQKEYLTKIDLYICRENITYGSCIIAIRDNLTGENLAQTNIASNEVPTYPEFSWITFDFIDLDVTIGQTYYIIAYGDGAGFNLYDWGGNFSDSYPNGTMYFLDDYYGWTNFSVDMCFKTYGTSEVTPSLTVASITGGLGIDVLMQNTGSIPVTNITWNITVTGGLFNLINYETKNTTPHLAVGDSIHVKTPPILGFGTMLITFQADCAEKASAYTEKKALQLIIFTLIL